MRVAPRAMTTALALSSGCWSLVITTPMSLTHHRRRNQVAFVSGGRRTGDTAAALMMMSVVPQKDGAYNNAGGGRISSSPKSPAGVEETRAHGNTDAVGGAGRSSREISNELSLGVTLDGGPVVDFASIKDSTSRAELALAAARKTYEASSSSDGSGPSSVGILNTGTGGGRLMGINDEVVAEVGYEIGTFVDEYVDASSGETANELVQKCASYIRSKAGVGAFPQSRGGGTGTGEFAGGEVSRFDRLLARAYEESGIVTAAFAKTFYLGTQVLPDPAMRAIWAIYVWCRRTDEIVDAPRPGAEDPDAEMLADLSAWEIRLERLFDRGDIVDVLDLPLLDCKVKFPKLPITPFSDMIRGMLMDIPGLGQERYDTWDELHLYCYRVAGTVGLMSMPVFGCAPGYTDEIAK